MANTIPTETDRHLFYIGVDDVQHIASKLIGRQLTDSELDRVKDGVDAGLVDWEYVVKEAIRNTIAEEEERT
jgi:hypothetical protein